MRLVKFEVLYVVANVSLFISQMFQLAKNLRTSRQAWAPVLQRWLSASGLSEHNQQRTVECQNGEKVCNCG